MKKQLLFILSFVSSLTFGMDKLPSTNSTFFAVLTGNLGHSVRSLRKSSSYIKWFHSLPSVVQSTILVHKAYRDYVSTCVNHYLKETCTYAQKINFKIVGLLLHTPIKVLSQQLDIDTVDWHKITAQHEALLQTINNRGKVTQHELNLLLEDALKLQILDDRIVFTQWQLDKANQIIKWQKKINQKYKQITFTNVSECKDAQKQVNNIKLKLYEELYPKEKKACKNVGKAENQNEMFMYLDELDKTRREIYKHETEKRILQKKIRNFNPNKLPVVQPKNPSSTTSDYVGYDYSTTGPSSGTYEIVESTVKKLLAKTNRTEHEQAIVDAYQENIKFVHALEQYHKTRGIGSGWQKLTPIKNITYSLNILDKYLDAKIDQAQKARYASEKFHKEQLHKIWGNLGYSSEQIDALWEVSKLASMGTNDLNERLLGSVKGFVNVTKDIAEHPVTNAAKPFIAAKELALLGAKIAPDIAKIELGYLLGNAQLINEGMQGLQAKGEALGSALIHQINHFASLTPAQQSQYATEFGIDLLMLDNLTRLYIRGGIAGYHGFKDLGSCSFAEADYLGLKEPLAPLRVRCQIASENIFNITQQHKMLRYGEQVKIAAQLEQLCEQELKILQ